MPVVGAFIGAVLLPYGMWGGLLIAGIIVVTNAVLMEKDPSGLGPNEVVIPFHLVIFAIPTAISAWFGCSLRELLAPAATSSNSS
jgi:hypothetical protein